MPKPGQAVLVAGDAIECGGGTSQAAQTCPASRAVVAAAEPMPSLRAAAAFDLYGLRTPAPGSGAACDRVGPGAARQVCAPGPVSAQTDALIARLVAVLQPPLEQLVAPGGVLQWHAPLLPYQQQGVQALLERPALLLADEMGLGKTIQAIAALRILAHRDGMTDALIVCPSSLLVQWQRELALWAPELAVVPVRGDPASRATLWRQPAHVRLVSYDTLRSDTLEVENAPALRGTLPCVILDEASRIKNRDTGISRACRALRGERRWALTGTPLENKVDDVASILEFLLGESGGSAEISCDRAALKERLATLQLRRRKADVLTELPEKSVVDLTVDLAEGQRAAYDMAEREGIVRLSSSSQPVTVTHILELIGRLKQICNRDPATGQSAKLDDMVERLRQVVAEDQQALVFSQFTDAGFGTRWVCSALQEMRPLELTGAMAAGARQEMVDRFTQSRDHRVMVLSLRAGGVGLNLQAASYVFHLDRWWNPAVEEQAEARAHRMGQRYPVTVYRYVCADTIEERIDAKLREKRALFSEIVDDVSIDLSASLSEQELFGLFGLSAPRKTGPARAGRDAASFGEMDGEAFERWLRDRLQAQGFAAELTARSRDGGIDIRAERIDELGIASLLLIQCKNQQAPVGVAVVRELRGAMPDRTPGIHPIVAAPSGFTADARAFARDHGIDLWDTAKLAGL
ncbi:MAG: SNF2-related protein [Armatimonadetes bacterium]|nr:SNF2-related protein [Armatimonadota bacterium]